MSGKHQIFSGSKNTRTKAGRKWRRQAKQAMGRGPRGPKVKMAKMPKGKKGAPDIRRTYDPTPLNPLAEKLQPFVNPTQL